MFLKRCEYPAINLRDIFIGASLKIYAREIKVTDYGDIFTKKAFEAGRAKLFL